MKNIERLVRNNIRLLTPYTCARDEYSGRKGIFLDANENPYGDLNRYPDPYHRELRSAISCLKGIKPESIFLGNGSDEVIDLTYRIFCNPGKDSALIFTPTYGMYEVLAGINDVTVLKIPLTGNFQIDLENSSSWRTDKNLKLIFICSPNNPTGNCISIESISKITEDFRGIVLIDEAYIDFSDKPSALNLLKKYPNLIVMQTFSKAWGAAAIRVGIAFSNPGIISCFYKVKTPYNISTLNQNEALKRLYDGEKFRNQIRKIKAERERLKRQLNGLAFTEKVYQSDANFLLVKVTNATLIYQKLIEKNIIVRNRASVIENCLRITTGTRTENNLLIKELKKITL